MEQVKVAGSFLKLFNIEYGIKGIANTPGMRVQVISAKNLKIIAQELDPIREKIKYSEEFQEILNKSETVKQSYATKDEAGEATLTADKTAYIVSDDNLEPLKIALQDFWKEEENAKAKDERDALEKEYEGFINNEECEVTLYAYPEECLPEEFLSKEENLEVTRIFVQTCTDLII